MGIYEFDFNDLTLNNEQFMKVCKAYPSCEGCPLKSENKEINGVRYHCHTGRGE